MTPTASVDLKDFDRILNTNLKGTVYCVKAVLAAMIAQEPLTFTSSRPRSEGRGPKNLGRGSIVNLGSVYSHLADYGLLAYTVAKHGVMGVTKAAALDHAGNGIRVNAVCPGSVDTPIMQKGITDIPPLAQIIEKTVLLGGRMAHVEEVAGAIAFLCSPSASYITGTGLTIDGGATLNVSSL
jgi:NAD(P)-dependent dehydrogenase (short-subunit alcohol dehydrogenase family)